MAGRFRGNCFHKNGGMTVEYDYGEYRKDSQALFREEEKRGETLERFEASEKRRREGREPERVLALKNSYGQFELGVSGTKTEKQPEKAQRSQEKLALVSGLRKERKKELRDYETFHETGSVPLSSLQKRGRVNPHKKEKSAALLRLEPEKTGNRLAKGLSELAEKEKLETVQEMFPFLQNKAEREERKILMEEREKTGILSTEKSHYLDHIKENELHKQREKQKFVQKADYTFRTEKEKQKQETKKTGAWEEYRKKLWESGLLNDENANEDDENRENNEKKD